MLVLIIAFSFIACVSWEIYDPPGEDIQLLSFDVGNFQVEVSEGEEDLGTCTIEVSAFVDPGRPGLAVKIKLLCTLSKPPPPAVPLLYASDLSCRIVLSLSGSEVAEKELPVGGIVLKAPNAPYQLLDEHDVRAEELSTASGLVDLSLKVELLRKDEILADKVVEKTFLIPPDWALPLTISIACIVAFFYWLNVRRTKEKM